MKSSYTSPYQITGWIKDLLATPDLPKEVLVQIVPSNPQAQTLDVRVRNFSTTLSEDEKSTFHIKLENDFDKHLIPLCMQKKFSEAQCDSVARFYIDTAETPRRQLISFKKAISFVSKERCEKWKPMLEGKMNTDANYIGFFIREFVGAHPKDLPAHFTELKWRLEYILHFFIFQEKNSRYKKIEYNGIMDSIQKNPTLSDLQKKELEDILKTHIKF